VSAHPIQLPLKLSLSTDSRLTRAADLLIKANDAQNKGGLVEIEPNSGEVRYGSTELIDALRPLIPVL
jgi:hypothetical protein